MLRVVERVREFLEGERRGAVHLGLRVGDGERAAERGGDAHACETAQRVAPAEAPLDQIADRRLGAGIHADIVGIDEVIAVRGHANSWKQPVW